MMGVKTRSSKGGGGGLSVRMGSKSEMRALILDGGVTTLGSSAAADDDIGKSSKDGNKGSCSVLCRFRLIEGDEIDNLVTAYADAWTWCLGVF